MATMVADEAPADFAPEGYTVIVFDRSKVRHVGALSGDRAKGGNNGANPAPGTDAHLDVLVIARGRGELRGRHDVVTHNSTTSTVNAGFTPTYSVFATATGTVPFDPAVNRIVVTFTDGGGALRGSTSVAVRTQ